MEYFVVEQQYVDLFKRAWATHIHGDMGQDKRDAKGKGKGHTVGDVGSPQGQVAPPQPAPVQGAAASAGGLIVTCCRPTASRRVAAATPAPLPVPGTARLAAALLGSAESSSPRPAASVVVEEEDDEDKSGETHDGNQYEIGKKTDDNQPKKKAIQTIPAHTLWATKSRDSDNVSRAHTFLKAMTTAPCLHH